MSVWVLFAALWMTVLGPTPALADDAGSVMPVGASAALVPVGISADRKHHTGFSGSGALSAEVTGLYAITAGEMDDSFLLRPCATLKLGPLVACLGALIGSEAEFNVHVEVFSFQFGAWEAAIGGGWKDGPTVRAAIPLSSGLQRLRLRLMYAPLLHHATGAGLEFDL